jgi:hypothetical protein
MGRIDDPVDALRGKIGGKTLGAAKAAEAPRNGRRRGIGGRARERQNWRDAGLNGEAQRQRACFARAAEDEQAKALQRTAP